jgi:hypothetical protein
VSGTSAQKLFLCAFEHIKGCIVSWERNSEEVLARIDARVRSGIMRRSNDDFHFAGCRKEKGINGKAPLSEQEGSS